MEDKAIIELFRDMLEYKKKEARFLFIALISVIVINLLMVGAFLYFISNMETTTTTTTTTQSVDGQECLKVWCSMTRCQGILISSICPVTDTDTESIMRKKPKAIKSYANTI